MKCLIATTRLRGIESKDGDPIEFNAFKDLLRNLNNIKNVGLVVFTSIYSYDKETERQWLNDTQHTLVHTFMTEFQK